MDLYQNENKILSLEKALQDAESRFSAIASITVDAVIMADETQNIFFFNKGAELIFGYSTSEVLGRPLDLLIPDRFTQSHRKHIHDFSAETTPSRYMNQRKSEIWGRRKDGSEFPAEISISKWKKAGQTVFTAILRDITERKRIDETLRKEHAFRKPIEDSILAGIVAVDLDERLVYVNPAFCKMVGWGEDELIGSTPPFVFWPSEELQNLQNSFKKSLKGQGPRQVELRLCRRNGERFYVDILNAPLTDGHGKTIGKLSSVYDITEWKRIEEALRIREEQLARSQQIAHLGSWELDLVTNLLTWSNEIFRIFEIDPQKFGASYEAFLNAIHPDDREFVNNAYTSSVKEHSRYSIIHRLLMSDGRIKYVHEIGETFYNSEGDPLRSVGTVQDITDRKKLEEELIRAQKLDSLGVLAGGIAHDFNNILTGIIGNISLAKSFVESKEQLLSRLNDAERASLRASELAQQLLTFSKGGLPIKKTVSIQKLIENSVQFALIGSNVQSQLFFQESLWPVEVDEGQMSQVIQNLVINAKQAMPLGGTIRIEAKNLAIKDHGRQDMGLRKGDYLLISIRDQGTGIPKENLSKIFDPYFTTKPKGSGLGLSITHSIIQRHKGYITAESKPGGGTTFFIYLPASPQASVLQEKLETEEMTRGQGRVLVMDDEESILNVAAEMLRYLGYEVNLAKSGSEAVQMYKKAKDSDYPFDLVITDLTVPGDIGGVGTLQKLRKIDPQVKVIVSSGYSNDPAMADFKNFGFSDSLKKPYRAFEVSETVKRVLKSRRLDD